VTGAAWFDELERQQARFAPSAAREEALERLRRGAPAVVTGQQVGLFLGPALALYKAATAVVEARARAAVPVFWLQAEDHDAAEVSCCHVLDDRGGLSVIELSPLGSPRAALAHRKLGDGVEAALEALARTLAGAPERDACLALLRAAYRPENGWVEAFAEVMASIFAPEGLIVFHPRTAAVAALGRPVHRFAIERAETIDALLTAGPQPVPLRRGCLLSFFHPDGVAGDRFRPVRDEGGYRFPGGRIRHDALLAALDEEPLRFSTSALLRPLLQDHLFETAAYVGGPSELQYLRQAKPLYEAFGLAMPELVARARFVVTDPPARRRLAALGLRAAELEASAEELMVRLTSEASAPEAERVRGELARLKRGLEALRPALRERKLESALDKTTVHVARGLSRLAERIEAAARRGDETLRARLAYLHGRLWPDGQPQERRLGFAHFAAQFGPRAFVEAVLGAVREERGLQRGLEELPLWP
jgi:bacillithiol synthase